MATERLITLILPDTPAGFAHLSRHTENVPITTIDLDEAARIVLAAAVQGHEIRRTSAVGDVMIVITEHKPSQNPFGIGA